MELENAASFHHLIGARAAPLTKTWWSPLWRGLIADPKATHYKRLRSSLYLLLFCILHADRRTGTLYRKLPTIAAEMGISVYTIRKWLATLRKYGYVTTRSTGRATHITIQKWKPLKKLPGKFE